MLDRAEAVNRQAQRHSAVQHFGMQRRDAQIRVENTLGLVVGMRHVVPRHWFLTGNDTLARHGEESCLIEFKRRFLAEKGPKGQVKNFTDLEIVDWGALLPVAKQDIAQWCG